MSSTNLSILPLTLKMARPESEYGIIHGIERVDTSAFIRSDVNELYIVSCYNRNSNILYTTCGNDGLILLNSHLTSFMADLFRVAIADCLLRQHPITADVSAARMYQALATKFTANYMLSLKPYQSYISRLLFIEAFDECERCNGAYAPLIKQSNCAVDMVSTFISITITFLLHHEIGHLAAEDKTLNIYAENHIENYITSNVSSDIDVYFLREEAYADLFSINCCLAKYATNLSANHLKILLVYIVEYFCALNLLYPLGDDLHRLNENEGHMKTNIKIENSYWIHRRQILLDYINDFQFGENTIMCALNDELILLDKMNNAEELWICIDRLGSPPSEGARRFADVVARSFRNPSDFEILVVNSYTMEEWVAKI